MRFTKMQGLGNDYLYVYGPVPEDAAQLSRRLSDRHFGPGADGLIFMGPSSRADFSMRIFNADGSEAEMCGNGIRCVGKYLYAAMRQSPARIPAFAAGEPAVIPVISIIRRSPSFLYVR